MSDYGNNIGGKARSYMRGPRGKAFTYEDFTPEQLEALKGKDAYKGALEAGYVGTEAQFYRELGSLEQYIAEAKQSEQEAEESEQAARKWASRAQAEAERVSVPAAVGVYNVVLADRISGNKYALIVEEGKLLLLEVAADVNATELTLIDNKTGTAYVVAIYNGKLIIEEV